MGRFQQHRELLTYPINQLQTTSDDWSNYTVLG